MTPNIDAVKLYGYLCSQRKWQPYKTISHHLQDIDKDTVFTLLIYGVTCHVFKQDTISACFKINTNHTLSELEKLVTGHPKNGEYSKEWYLKKNRLRPPKVPETVINVDSKSNKPLANLVKSVSSKKNSRHKPLSKELYPRTKDKPLYNHLGKDFYDYTDEYEAHNVEYGHGRRKSDEWNDNTARNLKEELKRLRNIQKEDPNEFDREAMK